MTEDDVDEEEVPTVSEDLLAADDDRIRNAVVALFLIAVLASAVPAFTPLPMGYLYALAFLVIGWASVYLFVYRRIQDGLTRELATVKRILAGVAAAYLVYTVFGVFVRILSVDNVVTLGEANIVVWAVTVVAGIAAVVVADPERLVWFVATVFVLNFVIREIILASGTRLVVPNTIEGVAVYLGLLVPTMGVAYLVVYRDVARRIGDEFGNGQ